MCLCMQVINGNLYSVSDDGTMRIWRLDAAPRQQPVVKDGRPQSCPSLFEASSSRVSSAGPPLHRHVSVSAV